MLSLRMIALLWATPLADQKSCIPVSMGKTEVQMFTNMETNHTTLNESLRFQQMTELSEVCLRQPNRNEFYWIQFYKQCQDTDKTKTHFTVSINVLVRQNLCYTAKQFLHGNNIFLITTIITSVIVFRIFILVVSRLQAHQI